MYGVAHVFACVWWCFLGVQGMVAAVWVRTTRAGCVPAATGSEGHRGEGMQGAGEGRRAGTGMGPLHGRYYRAVEEARHWWRRGPRGGAR